MHGFVVILTLTRATLTALAHATQPDQTRISGLYDEADYDDVILLAMPASTMPSSCERAFDVFRMLEGLVTSSGAPSVTASPLELSPPRGPPLAEVAFIRAQPARHPEARLSKHIEAWLGTRLSRSPRPGGISLPSSNDGGRR